jgi:hypothetical protein
LKHEIKAVVFVRGKTWCLVASEFEDKSQGLEGCGGLGALLPFNNDSLHMHASCERARALVNKVVLPQLLDSLKTLEQALGV